MLCEDADDGYGVFSDQLHNEEGTSLRVICVLGSMNIAVGQSIRYRVFTMSR